MNKTPTFEEFWKVYPAHTKRKDTEKVWNKMSVQEKRKAIAAAPLYKAYIWQMPNPTPQNPLSWLRGQRWEDKYGDTTPPQPLHSEGRGVPCGQNATKKEQSRFHVSMLGQMNVRGKADGLNVPAIIIPEPVQTDLQSGCTEYKDLQSDGRITNAHTHSDGIANPAERPAFPDGMDKW